jgi:hypothetical protein
MTEAEWQTATDPRPILEFLRGKASDRKLRLFMCACCRGAWRRLKYEPLRRAVQAAEWFADGEANRDQMATLGKTVGKIWYALEDDAHDTFWSVLATTDPYAVAAPELSDRHVLNMALHVRAVSTQHRTALLRDIIGNPFRPAAVDPAWRSEAAVALSTAIYADRAFDRLPILADALEEAGCDHPDILTHCRSPDPHVRGCWVVDLVLGKE